MEYCPEMPSASMEHYKKLEEDLKKTFEKFLENSNWSEANYTSTNPQSIPSELSGLNPYVVIKNKLLNLIEPSTYVAFMKRVTISLGLILTLVTAKIFNDIANLG